MRIFLVDGSALAYRSFFAPGPGPAYAYASSLIALLERERPDAALVAMDTPKPTFRHEQFAAYKATRQKTPPELIAQLPNFERIARALGFAMYALDGWEADDVIGTLAVRAEAEGHEVYLVTGDKDFMQVVGERVKMYNPTRPGSEPVIQGEEAVREKFHCRPDQVIEVLALMGDSSDNVPGVYGVGEKTALKLIEEYSGLDDIYAHIDDIRPPSLRSKLLAGRESAYLSRDLVTIRTSAPITIGIEDLHYGGPDLAATRALFVELDFPSLVARISERRRTTVEQHRVDHVVKDAAQYDEFLGLLRGAGTFVLDLETTSLVALEAEIVGLAFAFEAGSAWYLAANLPEPIFGPGDRARTARERADPAGEDHGMFRDDRRLTTGTGLPGDPLRPPKGSDLQRFLADIAPVLADPRVAVVGQNLKYDMLVLGRYGLRPARPAFDTMLASYCLAAHQSQHGLDYLALKHLGVTKIPTSDLIGKGTKQRSMWDVPVDACGAYACEDAETTWRLYELFEKELRGSDVEAVFRDIEMPTLPVLLDMEAHGVLVDRDHLARLSTEMTERIEDLNRRIHELVARIAGRGDGAASPGDGTASTDGEGPPAKFVFNVASPKQLGEVLFDKLAVHEALGMKRVKKTKSGYSTDASVLEAMATQPVDGEPAISMRALVRAILEHRQFTKLKGTYVDALPALVHPFSGRIHTSFNQAVAATGRLSSADPNLQNIPVRTHEGRRIREAFIAPPGHVLLAADYSQVELRLMAHLSGDEALIEAFAQGIDIHRRTAALVFGIAEDAVDASQRNSAKAINFGIIYGMGAQRLSQTIDVTRKEATQFIENYFATFPKVKEWLDRQREEAQTTGVVSTLSGRRRKLDGLDGGDPRGFANMMNVAVNTPIQGTAADLIKIAMIRVDEALRRSDLRARMILQVHDELLFEVPDGEVEDVRALAVEHMQGAMTLSVPLLVETGTGRNWVEAH